MQKSGSSSAATSFSLLLNHQRSLSFSSEVEVYLVDHIPIAVWDREGV